MSDADFAGDPRGGAVFREVFVKGHATNGSRASK